MTIVLPYAYNFEETKNANTMVRFDLANWPVSI